MRFNFKSSVEQRVTRKPKASKVTNIHVAATRIYNPPKTTRKPKVVKVDEFVEQTSTITELGISVPMLPNIPKELIDFINNAKVIATVVRQGCCIYTLEGNYLIRVTEVMVEGRPKVEVVLKQGRNHIFNHII